MKKRLLIPLLFALCVCIASTAIAATIVQDDVSVTLMTDQTEYTKLSDIIAMLTVTNEAELPIASVKMELLGIDGYTFSSSSNPEIQIPRLESGMSESLRVVYVPANAADAVPVTGDTSNVAFWMVLLIVSAVCLFAIGRHFRNARRMLSLFLCIALVSSFCGQPIAAASADSISAQNWPQKMTVFSRMASGNQVKTISISEKVTVDGLELEIAATISYILVGQNDNLNDGVIDLGDVLDLVSRNQIEVSYGENGSILFIHGAFTQQKVHSVRDAADVLNSAASLFGPDFYADESDIRVQTVELSSGNTNTYYRLTSKRNGLTVLGSEIVLTVNQAGAIVSLSSSYDQQIDTVDTYASVSESDAKGAAKTALLQDAQIRSLMDQIASSNPSLTDQQIETALLNNLNVSSRKLIYAASDDLPVATVYAVTLTSGTSIDLAGMTTPQTLPYISLVYYVYANGEKAGTIHSSTTNLYTWSTVTLQAPDLLGKTRTFTGQKQDNKYRLKDTTRSVETYRTTYGNLFWTTPELPGKLVESSGLFTQSFDAVDVSAHANISEVYDYYKNLFGRKSFDGRGATVKVSTEYDNMNLIFSGDYYNAFWSPGLQQFVIGDDGNLAAGLDVLGHEFTHAVINYVVGNGYDISLTYQDESGALNESLADIMGSLIEDKSGRGRWLMGEDTDQALRSLADPSAYNQPEHYNNRYVRDPNDTPSNANDHGGVHRNSGIFNLAAYKMMTDSRNRNVSYETWAEIFYHSMYRLVPDATFLMARNAVLAAAKDQGFDHSQQQAIKDAFDAVGITEYDSIRIILTWGAEPRDLDSHLVGPGVDGGRFHIYYADRNYYNDGSYSSDSELYAADLDYDDVTSFGPEVTTIHTFTPGTYYFYVHDYTTYSSDTSEIMSYSGATVKVYRGTSNTPIAAYQISPGKQGVIWNVFQLNIQNGNVRISPINTYSGSVTYH